MSNTPLDLRSSPSPALQCQLSRFVAQILSISAAVSSSELFGITQQPTPKHRLQFLPFPLFSPSSSFPPPLWRQRKPPPRSEIRRTLFPTLPRLPESIPPFLVRRASEIRRFKPHQKQILPPEPESPESTYPPSDFPETRFLHRVTRFLGNQQNSFWARVSNIERKMGGDCRYDISQAAYMKLVLHALKHKTSAVNGLLLGRDLCNDADNPSVEIVESVPLSHSLIGLLPTLEIALIQVEEHFASKGMSVVGYYHANERYDDFELGNIAKKIGDHISRNFPQATLLLLDNKKLGVLAKGSNLSPVVQLYTRDSLKGWRQAGSDASGQLILKEPSTNLVLWDYILSGKFHEIVDFDDHLDDISKDWLNPNIFK